MHIRMVGASDLGRVRKNNEDSLFFDANLGLGIVCDGIGGREGGEVASQLARDTMVDQIRACTQPDRESFLPSAVEMANRKIVDEGRRRIELEGMGTTMECLLFNHGFLHLTHIGDSRTYLFYSGHFWQLTIDHNIKTLVEYGDVPREMNTRNYGDALVRALGIENKAEPDFYKVKMRPGQTFITASDGLFDMVSDQDIAKTVSKMDQDGEGLVKDLIAQACQNGGVDNVTVLVTHISE